MFNLTIEEERLIEEIRDLNEYEDIKIKKDDKNRIIYTITSHKRIVIDRQS